MWCIQMRNAAVRDCGKTRSTTVQCVGTVWSVSERQHNVVGNSRHPSQRSWNRQVTVTREQSRPTKSVTEKGSPISLILFSLGVYAKAQEQSAKAVLDRKFLEKSSLTNRVPHKGTASDLLSSDRGEN